MSGIGFLVTASYDLGRRLATHAVHHGGWSFRGTSGGQPIFSDQDDFTIRVVSFDMLGERVRGIEAPRLYIIGSSIPRTDREEHNWLMARSRPGAEVFYLPEH